MGTPNSKLPTTVTLPIKELPKFWTRYELLTGNAKFNFWKLKAKLTKKDRREYFTN